MSDSWLPLISAVAPNGARRTKADHPALPMTAAEMAQTAAACREAGASLLHLHVRDRDGRHSLDADTYRDAIAAVKREVGDGMIIQATSEAAGVFERPAQVAMVQAVRPEAVSLALRELLSEGFDEKEGASFFAWCLRERIQVQYILYSAAEVTRFRDLQARGIIPQEQPFVLYVLGRYAVGQRSSPADLLPFLEAGAGLDRWAVCAFGPRESACALTAVALGGHSRVGFENNLQAADGTPAADNAALVAGISAGAKAMGRPLADATTARAMLAD